MKKSRALLMSVFFLFLLFPACVSAYEVKTGTTVYIDKDEVIEGNLYAGANIITIDGIVKGDVICGGQTININGRVEGDVICGGQSINLNGFIDGSARVAGNTININNEITRGVQAFGASIIFGTDAQIKRDVFVAGAFGDMRGQIEGDLHGALANLTLDGKVDKNVKLRLDERIRDKKSGFSKGLEAPLIVTKNAIINGNLYYTSGIEAKIEDGATINGETGHSYIKSKREKNSGVENWAWELLFSIFASLVVGLVIVNIFGEKVKKMTEVMKTKISLSIGIGVIIMFITPLIILFLLITIIGAPLSLMLLALFMIALYISKIFTAIIIGDYLFQKTMKKKQTLLWSMVLGIVATYFIYSIPVLGWLLCLFATWYGLGGLWLYLRSEK
jgi:hypothetical protein